MRRILGMVLLLSVFLYGEFLDDDMDGIPNEEDHCPNSALTDIVGVDGCTVDRVVFKKEHHFDMTVGIAHSEYDDGESDDAQNLSIGYYYGNFSSYLYTSNTSLQNGESGVDDTALSFYYRQVDNTISYKLGAGLYLPTSDRTDNKTDYFLSAKVIYYRDAWDFALDLQHTFIQDLDMKDSDRISLNIGYLLSEKTYGSISYTTQKSIYSGEKSLDSTAFYLSYFFDTHWFLSADLSKGLSDTATDLYYGMRVGYYF